MSLIAPLSDIPIFYAEYLTMYTVHIHAGAIGSLLYGLCVCKGDNGDNPLAKARGLSSRTYAQPIQELTLAAYYR